jgi:hypothetical protein
MVLGNIAVLLGTGQYHLFSTIAGLLQLTKLSLAIPSDGRSESLSA